MKMKFISKLALLALIAINGRSFAQCNISGLAANYCANSAAVTLTPGTPGGTFSGPGISGNVFTPSLAGVGTQTITYAICTPSYIISSGTYSPLPSAGTGVSLTDDQVSSACAIGFNFKFFCNTYTNLYISSNGFITFNANNSTSNVNGCCNGQFLPNNTTPDEMIAFAWVDLHPPSSSGAITYTTLGTAPNRKCVVTFSAINHYNSASYCCPLTSQVILYESTNVIEIHTTTKPLPTSTSTTYSCTMGIENLGGTVAFPVTGRNASPTWTATNEMYRWTPVSSCLVTQTTNVSPSGVSIVGTSSLCSGSAGTLSASGNTSYTWTPISSNASSITVNPATTTSYSVSATNSVGCISNGVVTVTVYPGSPTISIASSTNVTCPGKSTTLTASGAANYTWSGGITNAQGFTVAATTAFTVTGSNACGSTTAAITITVQPIQIATLSSPTVVCAGSSATLTAASAGTSYTWQPFSLPGASVIVNPTTTTVYTVTTSDGTCTGVANITVGANPIPTITSVASSTQICAGVTVTLSATGGVSYVWTPGPVTGSVITVQPNTPTAYMVVGSNSAGCTASSQQVIIVSSSPTLNVNALDGLICNGGSTSLTVTGANTYNWSSGGTATMEPVSPTVPTTYTVVGTSSVNLCSTTATLFVDVFTPSVSISGNTVICNGFTTALTGSGATSYTWDPGTLPFANATFGPSVTTIYTLTTITNTNNLNCGATNTIQVVVNPNPTVTASSTRSVMCTRESVTITATGASSYSWNTSATTAVIVLSPTLVTNLNLQVTGTNSQSCSATATLSIKVNGCVGVAENNLFESKLEVYPNPNNGEFLLRYTSAIKLNLVNELGQFIKTISLDESNNYSYNVSGLASGIYFVEATKEGKKVNQKIVVTR